MTVTTLQMIQALAALISSCLAGTALLYTILAYNRNLKIAHYNELDKNYQILLNIAFQNPYLVRPDTITTPEQLEKYDIYSFMVWNFLEAIYDKCLTDEHLKETWEPIIEVEGLMHYKWFAREDNKPKFKQRFSDYVDSLVVKNSQSNASVV